MRGSWREALRTAADLGYDGVELAVRDPSQVDAEAVLRTVRDAGLAVPAIGTGQAYLKDGLSLSHPDEGIRARAIERLETHIRIATVFGAAVIVGLLRGRITGDRAATEARLSGALRRILPLAEREKIPVVFEPVNRYETDFLVTMDEVLDLINRLASPALGILADTFHMNIEEASIESSLRRARPRLRHVHVADSNRHAPGWGHLDFPALVRVLRELGYTGYLSAEILPRPDPVSAARQAIAHLRPLLSA
ncbi:MAG: sugar phosphate isomerase/epimerase [Bacillati bacterium ANGP1]|uniref:Sugar phosphate isomerase/epimerase n=1 Tax=Candidatus Segetimicrobium genomatis TaxID=2569760 RepID=A0A537KYD1_9BACT|nr:MAG: sugar phosphate isomerase/epimerase [Terrabacteria group bacterium ANGP1]